MLRRAHSSSRALRMVSEESEVGKTLPVDSVLNSTPRFWKKSRVSETVNERRILLIWFLEEPA